MTRIYRDSLGLLWFCTPEGVAHFDGNRFSPSLSFGDDASDPDVSDIAETGTGSYLIGQYTARLRLYRPGDHDHRITTFKADIRNGPNTTRRLLRDSSGAVWVLTGWGLFQWTASPVPELRHIPLEPAGKRLSGSALLQQSNGSLWVATYDGRLYRRAPNGQREEYSDVTHADVPVWDMAQDGEGRLWLATERGIHVIDVGTGAPHAVARYTTRDGLPDNDIRALLRTADGVMWAGTAAGLAQFSGARFRAAKLAEAGKEAPVVSLAEDPSGDIWAGTEGAGVVRVAQAGFAEFGEPDGLNDGRLSDLTIDRQGHACAIFEQGGDVFADCHDETFRQQRFTLLERQPGGSFYGRNLRALQDSTGAWWFGGDRLFRSNGVMHSHSATLPWPYRGIATQAIFEDSRHDIWVGLAGQRPVTLRWDRVHDRVYEYAQKDGLPVSAAASAFAEDRSGAVWMGFYKGGLARWVNGAVSLVFNQEQLRNKITAIHPGADGALWVAADHGGVLRLDRSGAADRTVRFDISTGLSSNRVFCIAEDRYGRLYFGTDRGVDRMEPADTSRAHIMHYSKSAGMPDDAIAYAAADSSGALWFGSELGKIIRLVPKHESQSVPPPPRITSMRAAGSPVPVPDLGAKSLGPLTLSYTQASLDIEFGAIDPGAGAELRYVYLLRNADPKWSRPAHVLSVHYVGLSPGVYDFLVRTVSPIGSESAPASVHVVVQGPFWREWWFIFLASTCIAAAVYGWHRHRLNYLIALERLRTKLATDLHDDIGSSLSQIALLSEVAQRTADHGETLGRIASVARELIDSMSDLVWAVNPRRDHLCDLIQRMRRFGDDVCSASDIDFAFHAPEEWRELALDAETRRHLYLIYKELLHNAVRHSSCARIEAHLSIEDGWLALYVQDDGCGLTEEPHGYGGHGLRSMRGRVGALSGTMDMVSTRQMGVRVRVRVPTSRLGSGPYLNRWGRFVAAAFKLGRNGEH